MKKRSLVIPLVFALALTAFCAGGAFAGTFKDLQSVIDGAARGATITLAEDYTYDLAIDSPDIMDGIVINKALTVDGAGHTVNALGYSRAFLIKGVKGADKVTFKNLTVKKGGVARLKGDNDGTKSGGGFYISQENNADFINCVIRECGTEKGVHTRDGGAALFIDSKANVSFTDCVITKNNGQDRAGGLYLKGNAVLRNCRITDNNCGSRGGGIYVDPGYTVPDRGGDWGGNIKMYDCRITGNIGGRGGGAYINSENDKLNVFENCVIADNDVSANGIGNGGGILFYNAKAKMTDCTVLSNKARYGGGVIMDVLTDLELINCNITNNLATADGGGIFAHDGSHDNNRMKPVGVGKIKNCFVKDNGCLKDEVKQPQDIAVFYSTHGTEGWIPEGKTPAKNDPEIYPTVWEDRYDGRFISEGGNTFGTVYMKRANAPRSAESPVTLSNSDAADAVKGGYAPNSGGGGGCNAFGALGALAALALLPALRKKSR
jgi:Synergist-CTERM protein sorting domain-containing protein